MVGPGLISPSAVAQDQSQPLIQYHDLLQLLSAAIIDTIIHQADQCRDLVSGSKRKQSAADQIRPFYNTWTPLSLFSIHNQKLFQIFQFSSMGEADLSLVA